MRRVQAFAAVTACCRIELRTVCLQVAILHRAVPLAKSCTLSLWYPTRAPHGMQHSEAPQDTRAFITSCIVCTQACACPGSDGPRRRAGFCTTETPRNSAHEQADNEHCSMEYHCKVLHPAAVALL